MADDRHNIKLDRESFDTLRENKPDGVTWSYYLTKVRWDMGWWEEGPTSLTVLETVVRKAANSYRDDHPDVAGYLDGVAGDVAEARDMANDE